MNSQLNTSLIFCSRTEDLNETELQVGPILIKYKKYLYFNKNNLSIYYVCGFVTNILLLELIWFNVIFNYEDVVQFFRTFPAIFLNLGRKPKITNWENCTDRRKSKCTDCKYRYNMYGYYAICKLDSTIEDEIFWTVKTCNMYKKKK